MIYIEYRHRKKHCYCFGGQVEEELQFLYCLVQKSGWQCFDILFPTRGLPGDVTKVVYDEYIAHKNVGVNSATWLTTKELKICMNHVYERLISKLEFSEEGACKTLVEYRTLISHMEDYEKCGELARIVFF